ncbi:hypothetical protein M408DRAFT_17144 [Serendipita vermifera MAFF 305830]|uniref:Ribosomal protein L22 n=1 Tax=Serendipita vermifera MAFF 305830 TaxID=933852 RepID=A0A0C2X9P3_SERVB|nr:hypothetical protein M408DRAFT_17144 [Serendipita vermifera MAFF 305830]
MAWRDYIPGAVPQDNINTRGHLLDDNTKNKRAARRAALRTGRVNLFELHPGNKRILPIKQHLREKIPLRPVHGRPWYKTYRIKEEIDGRTRVLHASHRKLNKLANQISGKPIDYAILQMKFSEKRISAQVQRLLEETKQKAKEQDMNLDQLVVSQAWVGKGPKSPKKIDIRARGKFGVIRKSRSTMTIRLGRGLTEEQKVVKKAQRALDKVKIAEPVREETRVRFSRSQWAW